MSNYRLDYITKFIPGTVEEMTKIRAKFVELSEEIRLVRDRLGAKFRYDNYDNIYRTYEESLTHLETAQMYAIKMLCLIGEDNEP